MPDYPYIYADAPTRAVGEGGTRLRVFRRRTRQEDEQESDQESRQRESEWRELLEGAVAELNETLRGSGAPYECLLQEDQRGFLLQITRPNADPGAPAEIEEIEEVLDAKDLPSWLARLRTQLGILVDRTV